MKEKEFESIRKDLLRKMRFMDTTIKGISDSEEYKTNSAYNSGIRDAVDILKKHSGLDEVVDDPSEATRQMCEDAEKKFREGCYDMIESFNSPEEMVEILLEEYKKFTCVKAETSLNMDVIDTAKSLNSGESTLLAVKTPTKCSECDIYVCYRQYAGDPGDCFCGKTKETVNPEKKPAWCPLVSVGKKKNEKSM